MRFVVATMGFGLVASGCCRSMTAETDGGSDAEAGEGGGACATDSDCAFGAAWCSGGRCVACDNNGLTCTLPCGTGTTFYERNGCHPCECAPFNQCRSDADCGPGLTCYAGGFCWDWCPPGDPSCCYGDICSGTGCASPPPTGCMVRGCPSGTCESSSTGCGPTYCACSTGVWTCTSDCCSGTCVSTCPDGQPACGSVCCASPQFCCDGGPGAPPPYCTTGSCGGSGCFGVMCPDGRPMCGATCCDPNLDCCPGWRCCRP